MRAALAVSRVSPDVGHNLQSILDAVAMAAGAGADLVLFAETALTGLINTGDPGHDLSLGQAIPGPATDRIAAAARQARMYVALGLFEREGDSLFDSAILIDPDGRIAMKYRRISAGWRDRRWDASIYKDGDSLAKVDTPVGSIAILICGDLFDDSLCARIRDLQPDYVLCPMARNYGDNAYDQNRWDREDRSQYACRAKLADAPILMVNQLGGDFESGDSFGGAMTVDKHGCITAELPLGRPGMLIVDVPDEPLPSA